MSRRATENTNLNINRIRLEMLKQEEDPPDNFYTFPLEEDIFEWHFSLKGAVGTDFEGGIYHGRICLPRDYPFSPPDFFFLTPNGRFEVNTKICLSISKYHPEQWTPMWNIRSMLESVAAFLPSPAEGIGALQYTDKERKKLATKSHEYECKHCGSIQIHLEKINKNFEKKQESNKKLMEEQAEQDKLEKLENEDKLVGAIQNEVRVSQEQQEKKLNEYVKTETTDTNTTKEKPIEEVINKYRVNGTNLEKSLKENDEVNLSVRKDNDDTTKDKLDDPLVGHELSYKDRLDNCIENLVKEQQNNLESIMLSKKDISIDETKLAENNQENDKKSSENLPKYQKFIRENENSLQQDFDDQLMDAQEVTEVYKTISYRKSAKDLHAQQEIADRKASPKKNLSGDLGMNSEQEDENADTKAFQIRKAEKLQKIIQVLDILFVIMILTISGYVIYHIIDVLTSFSL